jgi:hypothetical protein
MEGKAGTNSLATQVSQVTGDEIAFDKILITEIE